MNRIRLLPEHVANQIAAGEVVERPASVVKELVENSLDAGATRITVEVQAGGRSLIRVTDDGTGMSRDDALLCLERHATSKIQRAEDLAAIATMGFRGEALPSIASVSRFTLTTRERDDSSKEATQIIINGGKIAEVKSAGAPAGTSLEVRQLFFNLPARRKFLRAEETEFAHIQHYLTLAAMAHPRVAFTFIHNGRTLWALAAATHPERQPALAERLRALWGGETNLLAVDFSGELPTTPLIAEATEAVTSKLETQNPKLAVWGFIGAPGVSRSTREQQLLFVNRRPVENKGLNHALLEGYHNALMKGRYPVCCLFLEIGPGEVDVNIHPSKREVKFHHERAVRGLVGQAVREALTEFHARPATEFKVQSSRFKVQGSSAPSAPGAPLPGTEKSPEPIELPNFSPSLPARPAVLPTKPEQSPLPMGFAAARPAESAPTAPAPALTHHSLLVTPTPPVSAPVPLLSVPMRLVGVIGKLYVVLESDRGLVLLDQHAAHERILYEQMLDRMERGDAPSQRLLLPETVELPPRDAQFLRENLASLTRLGVGLSEFGERTFLLDALPPFVKVADARRFVLEMIDELKAAGQSVGSWRLGESVVAKTVCRHAVKANDPLRGPELEALVENLRGCRMPYTCPHGRPTLIEMNFKELEKKFGRSQ
ncbi:MAG: DNA mismatch repair endonuclease MutL [Verrucomicrobia bacterium]|nr:DNA mismatch repair endonuclease MutL [Verrucomicrobiota bacterium]